MALTIIQILDKKQFYKKKSEENKSKLLANIKSSMW